MKPYPSITPPASMNTREMGREALDTYEVRKHKGRSGRSVFEWRIYHLFGAHGKVRSTQLAKYRSREAAERAVVIYREHAAKASP